MKVSMVYFPLSVTLGFLCGSVFIIFLRTVLLYPLRLIHSLHDSGEEEGQIPKLAVKKKIFTVDCKSKTSWESFPSASLHYCLSGNPPRMTGR